MALVSAAPPTPTPETAPFWEGLAARELRLPKCGHCDHWFFPPSNVCPECSSRDVRWVQASGRARLYSYVLTHRPWIHWAADGPMSMALVDLVEGPRLVSTIVGCAQTPEALRIDMPVVATVVDLPDYGRMLCFRPEGPT